MLRPRSVSLWRTGWRVAGAGVLALAATLLILFPASAQQPGRGAVTIKSVSGAELRTMAPRIDGLRRSGELRLRVRKDDTLVRGRTHERYDQYFRGVRVYGADVAEQLNGGQVVSAFGNLYEGIDIDTTPTIEAHAARQTVAERAGVEIGREPELVIFPKGDTYHLAWRIRAATTADVREYFVDARDGSIVYDFSDRKTQGAVAQGNGVLGDLKKLSVSPSGSQFVTTDRLRPPAINTYDMRGDYVRAINYLNGVIDLTPSDLGTDSDNVWTDSARCRRPCLRRLDLRLLLQALRSARAGQSGSPAHQPDPPGTAAGHCEPGDPGRLLHQRLLLRRRHHGLRRRHTCWIHLFRPERRLPVGRARRRGA